MYTMIPFRTSRALNNAQRENSLFNDRFFRSFFDMNDWMGSAGFRVDIREKDDAYLLSAEMPGVSEDQINLTVDNDTLTISADLNVQTKDEDQNHYYYSERRSGHVERAFNLEGIHQEGITADYKNGVLTVTLPKDKPEPAKAQRRIAIGGSQEKQN